jgi:hypothetical protein
MMLENELFDGELDEKLHDLMLEEMNWQLQLEDVQLLLELLKLLELDLKVSEEDGEMHEELLEKELFEWQLGDWLLQALLDEQLKLLVLSEKLLKHELSKLLEQQIYGSDDE